MESNNGKLLVIEGIIIIVLVLFSGFLAYQNQSLVREIQKLSASTPTPSSTPTLSPSFSPSSSPTATPSASSMAKTPTPTPIPSD